MPDFVSYTLLRFEINVRAASVIGFVGAGGIGQELMFVIRQFVYQDIGAIVLMIIFAVAVIDTTITKSTVGDYSYITHHCQIIYSEIGNFCSIASHCRVNPGNHPLQRAALHHFSYRSRMFGMGEDDHEFFDWRRSHATRLGHDVWLGHGVTVLPGVSIGTGTAVGAGSVVTKDIQPFQVAAGVPAKPIRERFPEEIRAALF
jgi:phosphonate metabolism protein (transferase hexapeptide repeat family)